MVSAVFYRYSEKFSIELNDLDVTIDGADEVDVNLNCKLIAYRN